MRLTEVSRHYVDWSRIGELFQSGTHHYTVDQLVTRGVIIGFTAASSFLGYYLNDEEQTHCSNLTVSIAVGFLGFTLSHAVVIYPLIKKRWEMSAECSKLKSEIENYAAEINFPFRENLDKAIKEIMKLSLTDDKAGRASQTWGKRLRLLNTLLETLKSDSERMPSKEFWQRDTKDILGSLNDSSYNTNRMQMHK